MEVYKLLLEMRPGQHEISLPAEHSLVLHRVQGAGGVDHPASDGQEFHGSLGDPILDPVKVGRVRCVPFLEKERASEFRGFQRNSYVGSETY